MTFGVADRLRLLQLLPREGNLVTLRIVRDLRRELSFSEEELAALGVVENQAAQTIKWDTEHEVPKDIPIGLRALTLIVDLLRERDQQKKMTVELLDLYERFVPVYDPEPDPAPDRKQDGDRLERMP